MNYFCVFVYGPRGRLSVAARQYVVSDLEQCEAFEQSFVPDVTSQGHRQSNQLAQRTVLKLLFLLAPSSPYIRQQFEERECITEYCYKTSAGTCRL